MRTNGPLGGTREGPNVEVVEPGRHGRSSQDAAAPVARYAPEMTAARLPMRALDAALRDLGIPVTPDSRNLLGLLACDSGLLHSTVKRLSELRRPDESNLPDIDVQVDARMTAMFGSCSEPDLLRKSKRVGRQNKLLLALLLDRIGDAVPMQELLLVNGLHNATSRRLRELRTEHGHFAIEVSGTGDSTAYRLTNSTPDIDATAYYWLKSNIRQCSPKRITPHRRLLALLTARLGDAVPLDDLAYVLPKGESGGRGRTRSPQLAVARRIRELREEGWQVHSGTDKTRVDLRRSEYILETLDRLPAYERITAGVRTEVLDAAQMRCAQCGWGPSDGPMRGKKQLEVHHKRPQRARPEDVNDKANLIVLCNICHAGVEAKLKRASRGR